MSERWLLIRRRSRQRRQSRLLRRRLQHRNDARPDFSHSPIWCAGSGLEELRMSVWKLSATDRRALNPRATASPLPKLARLRHAAGLGECLFIGVRPEVIGARSERRG
jgi:hypothetical protein